MAHCPVKFRYVMRRLPAGPLRILDIGCANASAVAAKRWFKGCYYAGVDIVRWDGANAAAMDAFYLVGADGSGYEQIPETSFDLVLMNHVVEHMQEPEPVVAALCGKLKPGGLIWIAFPSLRSLSLPHSVDETLNFCDDSTHVRLPDVREIANVLLRNGVEIVDAGRSRETFFTGLGDVLKLWKRLAIRAVTGRFSGRGLWYVLGFEDHVLGQRKRN